MRFLFRFIPLLLGLVMLGAFLLGALMPERLVIVFGSALLILAYGLFELLGRRFRERDFWCSLILILIFASASFLFFLYLDGALERVITAALAAILTSLFAEYLYRWLYAVTRLPSHTLTVVASVVEVFTIFFVASDFIGLRIFLRLPVPLLAAGFFVFVTAIYLVVRFPQGTLGDLMPNAFLLGLFGVEFFWAILFLPTAFMVGGAILAVMWYCVAGLRRAAASGAPLRAPLRRYALLGSMLIFVIMLSARWT